MGLFGRREGNSDLRPFWTSAPIRTTDPATLHQHGITLVSKPEPDGRKMMATGWAIWTNGGFRDHQAADFLRDGYKAWRESGGSGVHRQMFLLDAFDRLRDIRPVVGHNVDVWTLPQAMATEAAGLYGLRAWVSSELLQLDREGVTLDTARRRDLFDALRTTNEAFLPVRSINDLEGLRGEAS